MPSTAQAVPALIQAVAEHADGYVRYRALVPAMYVLVFVEALLRMLVGHMKPVVFSHAPPGAFLNYAMLPLAALMLWLSYRSSK